MKQISKTTEIFLKKKVCGIWFNVKVTFLQLCYKEILGESHCCGRMRNEEEKQILPLRAIILYKLLGTSIVPEPWAGGGLQHLTTAVWQGMVGKSRLGACLLCPMQSALSKVMGTQGWAMVSTNRFLWISAIYACPDICLAGRQEYVRQCRAGDTMLAYMITWPDDLRSWPFLLLTQNYGKEIIKE